MEEPSWVPESPSTIAQGHKCRNYKVKATATAPNSQSATSVTEGKGAVVAVKNGRQSKGHRSFKDHGVFTADPH